MPLPAAASLILLLTLAVPVAALQSNGDRQTAMPSYRLGFEYMRSEKLDEAAAAFQAAAETDRTFEMAFYMLGRVRMVQKRYAEASAAIGKARSLFQTTAGRQFANAQEAQRFRRDQILEIDELLRQLQTGAQTRQAQDQIRQLSERRRMLQEHIQRGLDMGLASSVPAYVSLSYGSAQFRMGNLPEAEEAYKEAIESDPKAGEAWNNLAVTYMLTGRIPDAERAVAEAEKAGFVVNPGLKDEIAKRRKG